MFFNSIEFSIFLPIVFGLYWMFRTRLALQNFILMSASFFFYGWWDWRFLLLLCFSALVDFFAGKQLYIRSKSSVRKFLLFSCFALNLGLLGYFKYYNFFVDSFVDAYRFFGNEMSARSLNVVLPVGISFYTFQSLSYSMSAYQRRLKPTKNILTYLTYVSFFPQLVAGPIEKAINLLPQFERNRTFSYDQAVDGMRQILWGLFKKMVVADTCAIYVNEYFANFSNYSGSTLFLGGIYFTIQIYCDFSGYSDIAIGTARLFGINLMQNFSFPYFSRSVSEFWKRWHISLTSWFREYLYFSLGGSRGTTFQTIRNILIVFTVSGLWHGANWTYVVWGFLNGIMFIPSLFVNKKMKSKVIAENSILPSFREIIGLLGTFLFLIFAWIIFRSESLTHAYQYMEIIFSKSFFTIPSIGNPKFYYKTTVVLLHISIVYMFVIEWINRRRKHALQFNLEKLHTRYLLYGVTFFLILAMSPNVASQFIYFQF